MNRIPKLALISLNSHYLFHFRTALFHSTHARMVDPHGHTHREPKPYKRMKNLKQDLLRKAEHEHVEFGSFSRRESWRDRYSNGWPGEYGGDSKRARSRVRKRGFSFSEDVEEKSQRLETDLSKDILSNDRIVLGLSDSGPLTLEQVKKAYRECALKWHPDLHDSSSKVIAEEKFKACNAAYESLCDKLRPK